MKLLYLVHRMPYPPNKGDKIRSFRWLEHLSTRHEVHLATFCDDTADRDYIPELKRRCVSLFVDEISRVRARVRALVRIPDGRPMSLNYFASPAMQAHVDGLLRRGAFDLVLGFSAPMAEFVRKVKCARVMDMVDVDSAKFSSYAATMKPPHSWIYGLEALRLARYEEWIARTFDATILCTAPESELLRRRVPGSEVVAISNGTVVPTLPVRDPSRPPAIVFVGAMDYLANVDAVVFAAREIMPLVRKDIPEAVFHIVGRDPTPAVLALKDLPGVAVHGAVPDIGFHLLKSRLSLVPLRIAQGIQNKILEAMAWSLPVVTSPRLLPSLGAIPEVHLKTAESAADYARAVVHLLRNPDQAESMGRAAREFVTHSFAWEPALKRLDQALSDAVDRRGALA